MRTAGLGAAVAGAWASVFALAARASEQAAEHGGAHGAHHGVDLNALIVQFLGFAILAVILVVWVFPVIGKALQSRAEGIRRSFTELDARAERARNEHLDTEKALREIERFSLERMEQAQAEGIRLRDELVREGERLARAIENRTKLEVHIERAKAVLDARNETVLASFDAVERVLRERVDEAAQAALLERFFQELDELKV